MAVVEYVGTYPGDKAHGNSTDEASSYVRSKPEAVKKMSEAVRDNKPSIAYKTLKRELSPDSRPNSTKQLENKRCNDAKKRRKNTDNRGGNIADHVQALEESPDSHPFARRVLRR